MWSCYWKRRWVYRFLIGFPAFCCSHYLFSLLIPFLYRLTFCCETQKERAVCIGQWRAPIPQPPTVFNCCAESKRNSLKLRYIVTPVFSMGPSWVGGCKPARRHARSMNISLISGHKLSPCMGSSLGPWPPALFTVIMQRWCYVLEVARLVDEDMPEAVGYIHPVSGSMHQAVGWHGYTHFWHLPWMNLLIAMVNTLYHMNIGVYNKYNWRDE